MTAKDPVIRLAAAAAGPSPVPNVWIDAIAHTTRPRLQASEHIPDKSGCAKFQLNNIIAQARI